MGCCVRHCSRLRHLQRTSFDQTGPRFRLLTVPLRVRSKCLAITSDQCKAICGSSGLAVPKRVLKHVTEVLQKATANGQSSVHYAGRLGRNLRKARINVGEKLEDVRYLRFELLDRGR